MSTEPDVVDALTRVLVRACRALAEAGEAGRAGTLAAAGWAVVRHTHPRQAQHLDGAMHHIARLDQPRDQPLDQPRDRRATNLRLVADPLGRETVMSDVPTNERELDVRSEEPKRRHELIFETFTDLPVGQSYVLVNDHDPKPLRYQFLAENAGEFSWEYLEEGPEVWRVRIGRTAAATAGA